MSIKRIKEGESTLQVPDVMRPEQGEVFYNTAQTLSRDMSILFYLAADVDVLDGMAATGARAVRLAKYGLDVTANDFSKKAIALVKKNARANKVKVETTNERLQKLLHERHFGAVDIDPFGSPAPFVHCALSSAIHYIGIAATDTAALAGTYPRVSKRRYGVTMKKLPNYHEVGVRALAGFVVREGAKLEVAAKPVFAHVYQHYYRLYFALKRGARAADALLKEMGAYQCVDPIYLGNLWDKTIVNKMVKASGHVELAHKETEKQLLLIKDELKFPQPYYDVHELCRKKRSCPSMEDVLKVTGGVRTHFTPTGFRCAMDSEKVKRAVSKI